VKFIREKGGNDMVVRKVFAGDWTYEELINY